MARRSPAMRPVAASLSVWPKCRILPKAPRRARRNSFTAACAISKPMISSSCAMRLIEREILMRKAPHLVWPLRLVLPHVEAQRPRWMIRLGLLLYDHLAPPPLLESSESIDLRQSSGRRGVEARIIAMPSPIPIAAAMMRASSSPIFWRRASRRADFRAARTHRRRASRRLLAIEA